jgi:GntR family transcriptional regulator, transcriptional repressor for pyruvate dehydrogenase complex
VSDPVPLSSFVFRVAERAPLSVLVSRQLRENIVSGKVPLGTQLPSEKELARDLGVSRTTVREALRILQAQGLLSGGETVSTHRPTVSNAQTVSTATSALEAVVRLGQVALDDLVELRITLECGALLAASERQNEVALAKAEAALALMSARNVDVAAFRSADVAFHQALAEASGNPGFALVMDAMRGAIVSHLGETLLQVPNIKASMRRLTREHQAIFDAVCSGTGQKAQRLVTAHIRHFYRAQRDA